MLLILIQSLMLQGIMALAQRIIDYREEYGGFSRVEELKEVKGIGEVLFEQIRDSVTVEPAE